MKRGGRPLAGGAAACWAGSGVPRAAAGLGGGGRGAAPGPSGWLGRNPTVWGEQGESSSGFAAMQWGRGAYRKRSRSPPACPRSFDHFNTFEPPSSHTVHTYSPLNHAPSPPPWPTCKADPSSSLEQPPAVLSSDASSAAAASSKRAAWATQYSSVPSCRGQWGVVKACVGGGAQRTQGIQGGHYRVRILDVSAQGNGV